MVDCIGLENRSPFTGTGGSNPSASANVQFFFCVPPEKNSKAAKNFDAHDFHIS